MQRIPTLLLATVLGACATTAEEIPASRADRVHTLLDAGSGTRNIDMIAEANIASAGIAVAPADAWKALLNVYPELGLEITGADSRSRMVQSGNRRVRRLDGRRMSSYLDCGSGNAGQYADIYDVYLSVQTQLLPGQNGGSTVRTQVEASARDGAHGNAPVRCTSKRALEAKIVSSLQQKLASDQG